MQMVQLTGLEPDPLGVRVSPGPPTFEDVKHSISLALDIPLDYIVIKSIKSQDKEAITFNILLDALWIHGTGPKVAKYLGRGAQTFNRAMSRLLPGVSLQGGGQTWLHWMISCTEYKICNKCSTIKFIKDFSKYSGTSDGLDTLCKECKSLRNYTNYRTYAEYHKEYNRKHGAYKSAKKKSSVASSYRALG